MMVANELLSERTAIRIAQAYKKKEYEKVHIDDKDIEYLQHFRTGYFSIFIY